MDGHAKLAALMGAHPEVAILRRFGALSMQNLLYLQAELVALEKDLRVASADDNLSPDPDRARFHRDWYSLSHCGGGANEDNRSGKECVDELAGKQWQIVLRIREKLAEYSSSRNIFIDKRLDSSLFFSFFFLGVFFGAPSA